MCAAGEKYNENNHCIANVSTRENMKFDLTFSEPIRHMNQKRHIAKFWHNSDKFWQVSSNSGKLTYTNDYKRNHYSRYQNIFGNM